MIAEEPFQADRQYQKDEEGDEHAISQFARTGRADEDAIALKAPDRHDGQDHDPRQVLES